MFKRILKKYYGIDAEEMAPIKNYLTCHKENIRYLLVPLNSPVEEELVELEKIADHLTRNGDLSVGTFLYTNEKKRVVEWDSKTFCVLTCQLSSPKRNIQIGRKLAKFHYRGRSLNFSVKKLSRIGQWKTLWETRLDQMEKVWSTMLYQESEDEFERMFLESFPYYMAIGENAIQYLVDTELDDEPGRVDYGTVCHQRFSNYSWEANQWVKNPFDWVFDHCGRDIGDWTRERYLYNHRTSPPEIQQFFYEYQSVEKLSSFAWRLVFARIMFPLHYIECIEDYYSTSIDQHRRYLTERLEKYLQTSTEYERFLKHFYQQMEVPVQHMRIPVVEWL